MNLSIRSLTESDVPTIIDAFRQSNWPRPDTFEQYLKEQSEGERVIWVTYVDELFAGYVTLKWKSQYQPFAIANIPEIMDLNVLPSFRNLGIGSKLLEKAELLAASKGNTVGLGVGLYGGVDDEFNSGYGAAQKLYVKCGYVPDGLGITHNYKRVVRGDELLFADDIVLWFTKELYQ